MSISTREIIGKAVLETLERRQMLSSVTLVDGAMIVQGNSNTPNDVTIHTDGGSVWAVTDAGSSKKIAVSSVRQIRIIGGEAGDDVQVDSGVSIPVYVRTGSGNDTITTGSGNDTIFSGNGRDRIEAGAGDDRVNAGNGDDTVVAGGGNDRVDGGNGSDIIDDGTGNDTVNAASGDDTVYSGSGHDKIMLGVGRDHAMGVSALDDVISNPQDVIVDATPKTGDTPPAQTSDSGNGDTTGGDSGDGSGSGSTTTGSGGDDSGSGGTTDGGGSDGGGSDSGGGDQGTTPVAVPAATSFTLINADTDQPIAGYENMTGTVSIDLTTLPTKDLNIRANYDPSFTGSVIFGYDSNADFSTENLAPYSFNHDLYGDYYAWTPKVGNHTITATAFSGTGGTGTAGAVVTLQLDVAQSAVVNPTPPTTPPTDPTIPTPPTTPGDDAPANVITVMESTVDVDHAVQVNALSSNLKAGTVLTAKFLWDFGDPGSAYNQLVGWNAAHLYTQPGTYTITLTITNEDGKTSATTTTVNIAASNRKVIYVSNDGSDSASGLSPQSAVKTFAKAMGMVTDNTEVLFNSGDTFDVSTGGVISNTNVLIGSYGSGAKPVLYWTGARNYSAILTTNGKAKDVTIENLTFDSIFDKDHEKTGMPDAISAGGKNIAAFGDTFLNIGYGMNTNQKPTGVLMQQCNSPGPEDIRSYLIYCQGSDFVVIGNTIANSTREHCLRVDGTDRILIEDNNFTNLDNTANGDSLDTAKQTITVHSGTYAYVYGNTTHDGRVEIGPLGQGDGLKPSNFSLTLSWVRVENNDFNFNEENRLQVDFGTSNLMIDDNRISVVSGAGITIQSEGKYTSWPQYGDKTVTDATVTGDNVVTGADQDVSVGEGDIDVNILKGPAPVYSPAYKLVA